MDDRVGEAFELWKRLSPSEAYILGVEDLGGNLFIPTRDNIVIRRRELDNIWRSTLDISIRSMLRWARCYLDHQEPLKAPNDLMWAIGGHLMKGGPENPLLPSLLKASEKYMDHAISDLKVHRWPLEFQVMVVQRVNGLRSMLEQIPKNENTTQLMGSLGEKLLAYQELFPAHENMGPSHHDMITLMEEGEGHLARGDIYPRILAEIYACSERANVLEEKLLLELYKELPNFKKASFEMKDMFGTSLDIEDIQDSISKNRGLKRDDIIPSVRGLHDRLTFWGIRRLIDYPHEMDMDIKETPDHFKPFVRGGRFMMMDGLKGKPTSDLYLTLDNDHGRQMSFPELFLFLVHEELGHRAHYLNSYSRPVDDVRITDVVIGLMMASTFEGFANNREFDILGQMKDMNNRRQELLKDEIRLVDYIELSYPMSELISELEFLVSRNRVMGLLSAVADIRINTGKQSMMEFIRWAHIITGMEERSLFNVILGPAMTPGFHASQQLITMDLKQISQVLQNEGISIKEFNTWSTRLGFTPWRFLKEKILSYQDSSLPSR